MKFGKRLLAGVLCCMTVIVGCSTEVDQVEKPMVEAPVEETAEQSKLNALQPHAYGNVQGLSVEPGKMISIIGRGEKSSYWSNVKKGAKAAVDAINKSMGYKGKDKLVLNYSAPETEDDVDGQVNILDEELARYPIAVGIALADASASQVQFDLASDNGIPIVTFDSGTEYRDVMCMVNTDNLEAAATAAGKLSDMLNGTGKILVFAHDLNSTSGIERVNGFMNHISSTYPQVQIAEVCDLGNLEEKKLQIATEKVEEDTAVEDKEAAIQEMVANLTEDDVVREILEKHPDAGGIFATAESVCVQVLKVIKEMENPVDYRIVSFDGGKEQLERLNSEEIDGLIVQNPYGIGYATVVACVRASMGEGNEAVVDAGYTWVTKKNIKEDEISKMMY